LALAASIGREDAGRGRTARHDFQPSDLSREYILLIEAVCFEAVD